MIVIYYPIEYLIPIWLVSWRVVIDLLKMISVDNLSESMSLSALLPNKGSYLKKTIITLSFEEKTYSPQQTLKGAYNSHSL
jgi:hypothetical protein